MWGKMNVEMDSLAKVYWNETSSSVLPFYPPSTFGWTLWTGTRKLASWDRQKLYNHARSGTILEHWSERRQIPPNLIQNIDWEAGQVAIKRLGLNKQLWIPRWLAGFARVGKVSQRLKLQDHAECPRCAAFEDTHHVVLCTAPKAQRKWDASVSNLKTWLLKANTMPDIQQAILSRLQAWRTQTRLPDLFYRWPGVNDLVRAQDLIGWRAFLEGAVLQAWAAKQQDYYDWLQRCNTGRRWITTLIKKLWEISWNMWEHRNGELANPECAASLREHVRLDILITDEFDDLSTLAKRDRRWFRRPKEVLFTEPIEYKQQWLESVHLARVKCARRHRTSTQTQRNLMQSTFCRTTRNSNNQSV